MTVDFSASKPSFNSAMHCVVFNTVSLTVLNAFKGRTVPSLSWLPYVACIDGKCSNYQEGEEMTDLPHFN